MAIGRDVVRSRACRIEGEIDVGHLPKWGEPLLDLIVGPALALVLRSNASSIARRGSV